MEPQACCNCIYNNGTCQTLNNAIIHDETIKEYQYCCKEYVPEPNKQEWIDSLESDENNPLN